MATGYIPNETGWSHVSQNSSGQWTGYIRLYYSTTYKSSNNTSEVTIIPQFKASANEGNDYRFWADANTTYPGIWGGQSGSEERLYELPSGGYSASGYLKCGFAHESFANLLTSSDGAFSKTFTIQHNSSGVAKFKAGIKCTVTTMMTPNSNGISNLGAALSDEITVTGSTYTLTTAVSPSGYGTVTDGGTLAPTSTKSLTATPAATTAQYTYSFKNWTVSGTGASVSPTNTATTTFTMGTANATATANFKGTPRSYTLTLNKNSYVASVSGGGSKVNGSSVTATATLGSATGYTYSFDGWYAGSTRKSTSLSYTFNMPASDYTLEARGNRTVNSYTATFTAGTNVASVSGGGSKNYGASVTATATLSTATGYHFGFDGWYSGTTKVSSSNPYTFTMPANNVSYTAKGTKTANTYTVKFNKNNSSATGSTADESFTYDAAKALTSNGFSLTGYDFKGWAETASGAVKYTNGQSVKNLTATNGGTVNLYAVWEIKHYSVSYNANSGSSTPSTQNFDYGGSVKLSAAISRSNASAGSYTVTYNINYSGGSNPTAATAARTTKYTFSGWKASTDSTVYASSATYSKNASVTMTAQWSSTTTTAAVTLPSPTRTGYTFKGWSTSDSATTGSTGNYTPTGNVTLYAVWQLKTYTLSISQGTGSTISVTRNGTALANGATISHFDVLTISISANTGYNLGTHTVNGSTWTSGSQLTVSGAVAVVSSATKKTYTLTVTKSSTGVVVNVNRSSSPIGGGSIGLLSSGATLYHNDVIKVSYEKNAGYNLTAATVNGTTIPVKSTNIGETANITVTANQVVVVTVEQGAVMYIGNGTGFDQYQIFIGDGTNWNQYQAYIGDGTNWVAY